MSARINHKKRGLAVVASLMLVMLALAATAFANTRNSMQPGRTFFGRVVSGQHPNRLVTLHNGTGRAQRIQVIGMAGAGGYKFTLQANTPLLQRAGLPRCVEGLRLASGASCAFDVRVHTTRVGWWRSVLSVTYKSGWFNSGELEAHVVNAPSTAPRTTQPGSCTSIATVSEACGS